MIFAATLICAVGAGARQQTPSNTPTTAESSATSTASKKTSAAAHKTGATAHHTATGSSGKSSSSATTSAASHHSTRRTSRKSKNARVHGQQKIDSERATSIQQALIRDHYLSGEPSGVWDAESEAAMRRYQSDHGWQTKEVPDSRALIKLGLGPNNDHLLNPDSAMTSSPIAHRSDPPASASHAATSRQPVANSGEAQPTAKPSIAPENASPSPSAPTAPPKNSDDSANPQ